MSEELLRAARNGDEEAFAALYQKYFPLLLRLKNTYYLRNYVTEDWEQEARIALYQALRTYEKSKGVSFGSYYKSIISNQIYSLLRKQNALKRRDQKDEVSIDQKNRDRRTRFFSRDHLAGTFSDSASFVKRSNRKLRDPIFKKRSTNFSLLHARG